MDMATGAPLRLRLRLSLLPLLLVSFRAGKGAGGQAASG